MANMEATNIMRTNTQKDEGMPTMFAKQAIKKTRHANESKIELIIAHTDTVPFAQAIDLIYNSILGIYSSFVDFVNAFPP